MNGVRQTVFVARCLLAIFFGMLILSGCRAGQGEPCAKSEDCAAGLLCFIASDAKSSVDPGLTYRELGAKLNAHTCVSTEEMKAAATALGLAAKHEACRQANACEGYGWCVSRDDRCVAGSDEDCRASVACRAVGRCALRGEVCVAGSDQDCRNSMVCENLEHCRVNEQDYCGP